LLQISLELPFSFQRKEKAFCGYNFFSVPMKSIENSGQFEIIEIGTTRARIFQNFCFCFAMMNHWVPNVKIIDV
jgi:hypothetical protein